VEFTDGPASFSLSPDSGCPSRSLGWPDRIPGAALALDLTKAARWDFLPLDDNAFPAVRLARAAGEAGGTYPAVYNAANEESVAAFLAGRIGFLDIVDTVAQVVAAHRAESGELDLDGVLAADSWARDEARRALTVSTGSRGSSGSGKDRRDGVSTSVLAIVVGVPLSIACTIGHPCRPSGSASNVRSTWLVSVARSGLAVSVRPSTASS
jgi:hypothetical protein